MILVKFVPYNRKLCPQFRGHCIITPENCSEIPNGKVPWNGSYGIVWEQKRPTETLISFEIIAVQSIFKSIRAFSAKESATIKLMSVHYSLLWFKGGLLIDMTCNDLETYSD